MSAAHTPGPWIQVGKIVGVKDGELASVWDLDGCQYENAQLIAAAFDLLEALIEAVSIIESAGFGCDCEVASRQARAAIAKATGAAE